MEVKEFDENKNDQISFLIKSFQHTAKLKNKDMRIFLEKEV